MCRISRISICRVEELSDLKNMFDINVIEHAHTLMCVASNLHMTVCDGYTWINVVKRSAERPRRKYPTETCYSQSRGMRTYQPAFSKQLLSP